MNIEDIALQSVLHLGDASVRAVAIAVPIAFASLLVRRSAATQHALWTALLAGMLALPVLRPIAPPAYIHVRSAPSALATLTNIDTPSKPNRLTIAPPRREALRPPPTSRPWQFYAAIVYVLGLLFLASRLLAGLLITRHLVKRATAIEVTTAAPAFESSQVRVPLTVGYLFPSIILPPDWRTWDETTRRAVLAHEAAHVRRRDGLVNLMAAINTCIFWFHPLAWWIERRLAVLAEHAADDVAMESCADPQQYATILLSIASSLKGRLNGHKHRLVWGGVGMQGGRITERIRRALSSRPRARRSGRLVTAFIWSTAAVLVWFAGAVQFQSVARAQQYPPNIPESMRLTPRQAEELEQQHAANLDDEKITQKLLQYYFFTRRDQERAQLVFWLIDHHSESRLLGGSMFARMNDPAYDQEARKRWLAQVAQHPSDAAVLGNASYTLGDDDRAVAIDYLQRARALDPATWTQTLARDYSWALLARGVPGTPQLAAQVRASLLGSSDAGLIVATVQEMVGSANQSVLGARGPAIDVEQVRSMATELLGRVEQLQPGSQPVVELKEGLRQLGVSLITPQTAVINAGAPPVLRVGGNVQAANLVTSPPPVYPPDAQARGIEGTVKLQIRINDAGHVDSVEMISGDPALTGAAITAVQQYVYKPTLLNGKPCAVVTTVDVPFRLNR